LKAPPLLFLFDFQRHPPAHAWLPKRRFPPTRCPPIFVKIPPIFSWFALSPQNQWKCIQLLLRPLVIHSVPQISSLFGLAIFFFFFFMFCYLLLCFSTPDFPKFFFWFLLLPNRGRPLALFPYFFLFFFFFIFLDFVQIEQPWPAPVFSIFIVNVWEMILLFLTASGRTEGGSGSPTKTCFKVWVIFPPPLIF